jgi:hypothetical protein
MDPRAGLETAERETSVPMLRFECPTLGFPARNLVTMLTALSRRIFADNKKLLGGRKISMFTCLK